MTRPPLRKALDVAILAYGCTIVVATLVPFDFSEPDWLTHRRLGPPRWHEGEMVFRGAGVYTFGEAQSDLREAIATAGAFYVYAEINPARDDPEAPASIVAYARGGSDPSFAFDQEGGHLVVRLPDLSRNAREHTGREYAFASALHAGEWSRILVTCDRAAVRAYREGVSLGTYRDPSFHPERWARDSRLVMGNAADARRAWRGRLRAVEIGAGFPSAAVRARAGLPAPTEVDPGALPARVLFTFDASSGPPAGFRPQTRSLEGREPTLPWSLVPFSEPPNRRWARHDWLQNVLFFVPLGAFLAFRGVSLLRIGLLSLGLSLFVELAQLFLPTRHTQATDLVLNVTGSVITAGLVALFLRGVGRRPWIVD